MSAKSFIAVLLACVLVLPAAAKPADAAEAAAPMEVISLGEWSSILNTQRPAVAVVDLWASWCVSCIERFPRMVELAQRFEGRGVRFITLNLDDPKDQSGIDWANDFLAGLGGPFMHYRLEENLTRSFRALDLMSLPVVLVYDGGGRERFRLTNDNPNDQFTDEDVEAAIAALLSEHEIQGK